LCYLFIESKKHNILSKQKWTTFNDKTALITGTSSGIGLAIAEELAKRGASLILTAGSENKLNALAESVRKTGKSRCFHE
jgi:short-subunit dehydrogenase